MTRAVNFDRSSVPVRSSLAIQNACDQHGAGRYAWILTTEELQTSESWDKPADQPIIRHYACNWCIERKADTDLPEALATETIHTLLATELISDDDEEDQSFAMDPSNTTAVPEPTVRITSPSGSETVDGEGADLSRSDSTTRRRVSEDDSLEATLGTHSSRSGSIGSQARIEDSVEALDRLEDDLEALQTAAQVQSIASPAKKRQPLVAIDAAVQDASRGLHADVTSGVKNTVSKSASVRIKPTAPRPPLRKSASMNLKDGQAESGDKAATRRAAVARQPSLVPPKPAVKSTRAPTKPTFELPGEAVARRLKEQREARRSAQTNPDKAPVTIPQRVKSVRAPTVPKFELPGEAISRRKKEQHEKQLREQAEEERRRREFKAAPIRSNPAPASYPRETAASRARRVKAAGEDAQEASPPRVSAAPTVNKRASIMGLSSRPSLRKSASTISNVSTASTSSQSRGRFSMTDESESSRATSIAAVSPGDKRPTVSAEQAERQRLRGKELYEQDNNYIGERERERRHREMVAKMARDEAAERSRQASREWAERQRRRQSAMLQGQII